MASGLVLIVGDATSEPLDGQRASARSDPVPQDSQRASARSDPVKFCSHIQGEIKKTKHRIAQQKIEESMSFDERNKERDIQRRQLEEIFRVMEEQKEKFGVNDVSDIQEQLKMYIQ